MSGRLANLSNVVMGLALDRYPSLSSGVVNGILIAFNGVNLAMFLIALLGSPIRYVCWCHECVEQPTHPSLAVCLPVQEVDREPAVLVEAQVCSRVTRVTGPHR